MWYSAHRPRIRLNQEEHDSCYIFHVDTCGVLFLKCAKQRLRKSRKNVPLLQVLSTKNKKISRKSLQPKYINPFNRQLRVLSVMSRAFELTVYETLGILRIYICIYKIM